MTELDELARAIAARLTPHALWDLAEVAAYLHRSEQHTRQWIVKLSDFPRPIRISSGKGAEQPRPLWRSKDVIAWAESFVETSNGGIHGGTPVSCRRKAAGRNVE